MYWAIGLVLLTVVIRLPTLVHPRAIDDETIYSVVATEMLHGGKPYLDAVERKPPLLFWTYALIFRVNGAYDWLGLHTAAVVWTLMTMAALYLIGRNLFDPQTGFVAALFYTVYQPWGYWRNLAFNGEVMMNLPIVLAVWLVLRPRTTRYRPELLVAGILLCCAFLLKQPAAIAAVPMGVYLLLPSYRERRGLSTMQSVLHAALLTLGFFVTLGGVAGLLDQQGILSEAYFWTIAHHDTPHGPTDPVFWIRGGRISLAFVVACLPLVLGAAFSLRRRSHGGRFVWEGRRPEWLALVGLLAASLVGTTASGRFYPHYFIQLFPPLVLLAAPAYTAAWANRTAHRWWVPPPTRTAAWLTVTVVVFLVAHVVGLAGRRTESDVGRYLRANSSPADRVFVWGQAPGIYLDARRRPASRYVATFPLTGYIFGSPLSWDPNHDTTDRIVPGSWDNAMADLDRTRPLFIVDTDAARPVPRYPIRQFPQLQQLIDERYVIDRRLPGGVLFRRIDTVE